MPSRRPDTTNWGYDVPTAGSAAVHPTLLETGRPWPEPDWELLSTDRGVIERQQDNDVFQWGPLTFAHDTPFVYGFWLRSWWRIQEILTHGSTWISGCANHDTLRRGTQVSPDLSINERLGDTYLQILDKAYDSPAIKLLTYTVFPGVPMGFLNASMRAARGVRPQPGRPVRRQGAERGGDLVDLARRR